MSGWTIVRNGSVTLEHLSTSSLVKITVEEYPDGHDQQPVYLEHFLEYNQFDDLSKCVEEVWRIPGL